jgi:hypothetical protein
LVFRKGKRGAMRSTDLTEQERVALEVIEALGDDAAPTMIHMVIRAQFRKGLRATLRSLRERGLLLRYSLGQYTLTPLGRSALSSRQEMVT